MKLSSKNGKIWFSSDWHINHNKDFIFKARGFNSVQEHNRFILETVNEQIAADDTLFYLGDMFLNSTDELAGSFLRQIRCKNLFYILGNHESLIKKMDSNYYTRNEFNANDRNWKVLGKRKNISIDGQFIVLDHFPIYSWENMGKGSWLCCGHSHSGANSFHAERKSLDVGIDNYPKLLEFRDLKVIMDAKPQSKEGHH